MARVNTPEVLVDIVDTSERVVTFTLNKDQIYEALFTWLRLKGIKIPSQSIDDYELRFLSWNNDMNKVEVKFFYKQKL